MAWLRAISGLYAGFIMRSDGNTAHTSIEPRSVTKDTTRDYRYEPNVSAFQWLIYYESLVLQVILSGNDPEERGLRSLFIHDIEGSHDLDH